MMYNLAEYGAYKFRTVHPDDKGAVAAFTALYVEAHETDAEKVLGELCVGEEDPSYWQEIFEDRERGHKAILVQKGTVPCGFMWWQQVDTIANLNVAWMNPAARGRNNSKPYGLGTALMLHTINEAQESGCAHLSGIVYPHNHRQIHVMRDLLGFKGNAGHDGVIEFKRAVDSPTPVLQRLESKTRAGARQRDQQLELAF